MASGSKIQGHKECLQDLAKGATLMEFSALVIHPNDRVKELGDLLAIARTEAQKRHGLKRGRIEVKEIVYVPSLGVYVALYRAPEARGGR